MLKSFDFVGEKVSLFNQGSSRWKTATGGVVSIFLFFLALVSTGLFGMDIILRENPILGFSVNKEENNLLPVQDLNMILALFPGLPANQELNLEKHFTVTLEYYELKGADGVQIKTNKLEKCDNTPLFKENKLDVMQNITFLTKFYYCIPEEFKETLYGAKAKKNSSVLSIAVSICTDENCAPVEETVKEIQFFSMQIITSDYFVDGFNADFPVQHSFFSLPVSSGADLTATVELFIRHLDFFSDDGWIFSRNSQNRMITVSDYNLTMGLRGKNPNLARYSIMFDEKKEVLKRRYVKIQEVMAKVGGLMKVIMTLSSALLNSWTSNQRIQSDLARVKRLISPSLVGVNSSVASVNVSSGTVNKVNARTKRVLDFNRGWKNWLCFTRHRRVLNEYETFYKEMLSIKTLKTLVLDFVSRNQIDIQSWKKASTFKEAALFTEQRLPQTNTLVS